jgi:hypothetical protein
MNKNDGTIHPDHRGDTWKKLVQPAPKSMDQRWEDGDGHHPKSREIYEAIAKVSMEHANDAFGWKSGGDGDNGEDLMFILDIAIDLGLIKGES